MRSPLQSLNISEREPLQTPLAASKLSVGMQSDASSSRAVATALKALQQRNRELENERTQLDQHIAQLEDSLNYERSQWEQKYVEEITEYSNKENDLLSCNRDLESRLDDAKTSNFRLEEEICQLKSQLANTETEKNRMAEQFEIEKESWSLQIDLLSNKLATYNDYQTEFEGVSQEINREKQELRDELIDTHHTLDHLKQEYESFKRISETEKENLVKLNEEVISSRDYYAKEYKGVKSALKVARKRVTELDQEAKTLRARVDAMETERASLETEKVSRENYIKDIVTVNDQLVATLNQKSRRVKRRQLSNSPRYCSPLRFTPGDEEALDLQSEIGNLENKIESQNRHYEALVAEARSEGADLKSIRAQLSELTEQMQMYGSRLETARHRLSQVHQKEQRKLLI